MYKISKDHPIPKGSSNGGRGGKPSKYPFKELASGESFFEPLYNREIKYVSGLLRSAGINALGAGQVRVEHRIENAVPGVRAWRV